MRGYPSYPVSLCDQPDVIAQAFSQALLAAQSYVGATAPNPPVGCVVLDADGQVLACKAHQRAGDFHAEAAAISVCRHGGSFACIDTIIVTLEPCNHHGRTPPCTNAIMSTPARTVWMAARDPNPSVSGQGAELLNSRGIQVHMLQNLEHEKTPALLQSAQRLIAPFTKWSTTGRPWITLKRAITSKGSMIPPLNQKTFTSPASLVLAHELRKRADAIITGSGTILADNPEFTVRLVADHPDKRRHLAIFDRRGRVPASYLDAARGRGFEVQQEQNIAQALERLGSQGVLEALVEAGPKLTATFLDQDIWDEIVTIRQDDDPAMADHVSVQTRHTSYHRQVVQTQ